MKFPHGPCECRDGCECAATPGPVAWEVTRDGKRIKVCTRCTLTDDTERKLLVVDTDNPLLYVEYDPLGATLIASTLKRASEKNPGLQVVMASGLWRDDKPGGIAAGMQFNEPDEGVDFCKVLETALPEYDMLTVSEVEEELRRLSPRRHELTVAETMHVIMCVHWMQRRGHLDADEYNGTIFGCVLNGNVVSSETNPVTIDLAKELTGKRAVDVTDIVKASELPDQGLAASLRTVIDHKRGER